MNQETTPERSTNPGRDGNLKGEMASARLELETWKTRAVKAEEELAALRTAVARPELPQPHPVTVDPGRTALLVLDLTNRCNDPAQVASRIAPRVKNFADRARAAGVLLIYTIMASGRDTPVGQVWDKFGRLPGEPVLAPDAYDKFTGGEMRDVCEKSGVRTVIITGASSNFAVLYTATTAARVCRYNVVVPVDGIIARSRYEDEYTLYQFTVLPGVSQLFSFTNLGDIAFASGR
ncbi:MAG: isochorismatase family protein [Chloroflexi bacterium]|nr:isochorismatase family protein [Chloroflexota bacterium]